MRGKDKFINIICAGLLLAAMVLALAIFYNHSARFDFTALKKFSLSLQSHNIVKGLKIDITAIAFYRSDKDMQAMKDVLDIYKFANPKFTYRFVDIQKEPDTAKLFKVTYPGMVVIKSRYGETLAGSCTEDSVTNGILKVLNKRAKILYCVFGHKEKDFENLGVQGLNLMSEELRREGYEVKKLNLLQTSRIPKDAAAVLIFGPEKDFLPQEVKQLESYFEEGGNICVLMDQEVLPNLEKFIKNYGLVVRNDIIIDPVSRAGSLSYVSPVVFDYSNHLISKDLKASSVFTTCRSLDVLEEKNHPGSQVLYIARSGNQSWGETDLDYLKRTKLAKKELAKDAFGPLYVAAVINYNTKGAGTAKMFVCGDVDFINNSNFYLLANRDLILNALAYLSEGENLVGTRAVREDFIPFVFEPNRRNFFIIVFLISIPLAVVLTGTIVYFRRFGI